MIGGFIRGHVQLYHHDFNVSKSEGNRNPKKRHAVLFLLARYCTAAIGMSVRSSVCLSRAGIYQTIKTGIMERFFWQYEV